jgi:hypothetical protein
MRCVLLAAVLVASGSLGCGTGIPGLDPSVEVVVVADVNPPPPTDDGLESDKLEDKKPTFDPALVDRRPLEGWLVNQSDAVIRLDVPLVRPDEDGDLLALRPSYAAAMKAAQKGRASTDVLPSVNLIAGKAKQFDDGLYAALDQAFFLGHASALPSHLDLVERLLKETDFSGEAAGYLAAGLTISRTAPYATAG